MSAGQADQGQDRATGLDRRQVMARAGSLAGAAAIGVATPAWATSSTDRRLNIYEGQYAIDSHKIVDGYFAAPRGRTGMDVLVVIPGEGGIDNAVRDLVRRHALAGNLAIAPDLAKTAGTRFSSRDAMIADFVAHVPRLKKHSRGNGTVRIIAA